MTRLVFFCCSTDFDDCCCWLFLLCFFVSLVSVLGTTELITIHFDAFFSFIDFLYTAWPFPPGFFPVFFPFLSGLLFFRRPNGLFVRCLSVFLFLASWVFLFGSRVRSACGFVRPVFPPPPPSPLPSPLVLLACAVRLASSSCMHSTWRCRPQWPRPLPAHHLARPSSPASCWETTGGRAGGWAGRVTGAIVTPHNSRPIIMIAQPWRYPAPYETQPFRQRWVL